MVQFSSAKTMLIRLTSHDLRSTVLSSLPVFANHEYKADRFVFVPHFA